MIQIDIEMPKSCKECPLTYTDTGDDAYFGMNTKRCVFDNAEINGEDSRYDDCPLACDSLVEDDDCISRSEAIRIASGYCHWSRIPEELAKLPSVKPKEPGNGNKIWTERFSALNAGAGTKSNLR